MSSSLFVFFRFGSGSQTKSAPTESESLGASNAASQQPTSRPNSQISPTSMEDGDTPMEESRPFDQHSEHPQQALSMQIIDGLQQVKAHLGTLNDKLRTLPNDVASMLRNGDGDLERQVAVQDRNLAPLGERTESLEKHIFELETHKATLISENENCKTLVEAAHRENERVRSLIKQREDLLKQQDRKLAENEQTIRSLYEEMDKLRHKESALRTIILDKAGTQKVSDQEIVAMFTNLRQRIQTIARLPVYRMDTASPSPRKMDEQQASFFDNKVWDRLTAEERTSRVRAKMFLMILHRILDFRLFGAEGVTVDAREGSGSEKYIAPALRRIEEALQNHKISEALISDWRILTIECVDKLRPQNPYAATVTAEEIFEFFRPILAKSATRRQEEEVKAKLLELCSEAVELRMIMRRSRDRYTCEIPGTLGWPLLASKCEELAETVAVEGGKPNQASDEIVYTVFGGLVKQAEDGDGKKIVLEKALVILKRK